MATHARLADVAVEVAMDAQDRTRQALRVIEDALGDGTVTPDEARAMVRHMRVALTAAEDVVVATERANVGQRVALSYLTTVPVNPYLRKQAAEVGLPLDNLVAFPGPDAA